jgi:hypothetical protein
MQLRRCLHITNLSTYEHIQKGDPGYDKLWQVRWFVDFICDACMREWSLDKFVTIDEMMVRYKGSFVLFGNICLRSPTPREVGDRVLGACRFSFQVYLLL